MYGGFCARKDTSLTEDNDRILFEINISLETDILNFAEDLYLKNL